MEKLEPVDEIESQSLLPVSPVRKINTDKGPSPNGETETFRGAGSMGLPRW